MDTRQKLVLIVVAVTIAGMMLYPPFYRSENLHYGWLIGNTYGEVAAGLLLAQFFAVVVIGLIVYLLCARKK